jgi:hypothetical protein
MSNRYDLEKIEDLRSEAFTGEARFRLGYDTDEFKPVDEDEMVQKRMKTWETGGI